MDAVITTCGIELFETIHDHYQEHFYNFLGNKHDFWLDFDLEVGTEYYDKSIVTPKGDRVFDFFGSNKATYQILERLEKNNKPFDFVDSSLSMESLKDSIDDKRSMIEQVLLTSGAPSYEKDFSKDRLIQIKFK